MWLVFSPKAKDDKGLTEFQNTEDAKHNHFVQVTSRMFRTVYTEVFLNLPFDSHGAMVLLREANGLDMGSHHYGRTSAIKMINFISETMHANLIMYLTKSDQAKNKKPISLIVDSSTDPRQRHFFAVLFQTLEEGKPVVYFYKLIELSSDESAQGLFNVISEEWRKEENNFYDYMQENLVGFASDSALVMTGRHGGLVTLFENFGIQRIFRIHCMAYHLNLAI